MVANRLFHWDIGYSRVDGQWGICLRVVSGSEFHDRDEDVEQWHFNESPLYLRHPAVDKLPELIEALAKTGANVAKKLTAATLCATQIAETQSHRSTSPRPEEGMTAMRTQTMIVCLAAIALIAFAIYFKDAVKAGGRFKGGEVYIEATEAKP